MPEWPPCVLAKMVRYPSARAEGFCRYFAQALRRQRPSTMELPKLTPGKRFTLPRPVGSADALLLAR